MARESIVVIGAGVLGLSTAITLQERLPAHSIIVIAAELPTDTSYTADYASMWAGAHYRPIPRSTRQLEDESQLAMTTAGVMKRIAEDTPEAGVAVMQGVEYIETPPDENLRLKTGDVYAGPRDDFRVLDQKELPDAVKWGCEYQAYCVNVPVYCRWMMRKFQHQGGRILRHRLEDPKAAFEVAQRLDLKGTKIVVNCSGRNFDKDPRMKIIRGQTVLVKQQYHKTVTRQSSDGSWSFLIPRPSGGGTIVGGSKEVGDFETRARPETRNALLRQAVKNFPDFVADITDFVVVRDNVGRRPWREGGLRIEPEVMVDGRVIVHGYGAGGRGYELSWGASREIADLVQTHLRLQASL